MVRSVSVSMCANFSRMLVWHFFADLMWNQFTFFDRNGIGNLYWNIVAYFSGLFMTGGFYNFSYSRFAHSLWDIMAMRNLDLSCNLNGYLCTNMLDLS